jgi:hypothetical protein
MYIKTQNKAPSRNLRPLYLAISLSEDGQSTSWWSRREAFVRLLESRVSITLDAEIMHCCKLLQRRDKNAPDVFRCVAGGDGGSTKSSALW